MVSGFVVFFKQKTAYEMRISDWISDVCSSDLALRALAVGREKGRSPAQPCEHLGRHRRRARRPAEARDRQRFLRLLAGKPREQGRQDMAHAARSEEHTSELQSLMRISYAVFCLKKNNKKSTTTRQSTRYE